MVEGPLEEEGLAGSDVPACLGLKAIASDGLDLQKFQARPKPPVMAGFGLSCGPSTENGETHSEDNLHHRVSI